MATTTAGGDAISASVLVVRRPGAWALAPSDASEVVRISTRRLLGLLAAGRGLGVAAAPDALPPPLDEGTVLEPRTAVVARIEAGTLAVEATDGRLVRLDPLDVCLFDVIDQWVTVAQVIDAVGERYGVDNTDRALLARRVGLIAGTGRVRVARRPAADAAPARLVIDHHDAHHHDALHHYVSVPLPDEAPAPPVDHAPSELPLAAPEDDQDQSLTVTYLDDPFPGGAVAGSVPVYAVWPVETGPVLALGMLTAAARRHDGGRLADWYEIRRPEEPRSFFADLGRRTGAAVLLLSNYVWSVAQNMAIARRARALCPGLVIIHGGPSTPKYEGDVERFFAEHAGLVDVTVRGEGEALSLIHI